MGVTYRWNIWHIFLDYFDNSSIARKNRVIISRITASLILAVLLIGPGHYQDGGDEKLKITVIQPLTTNMERIINMTNEAESDLVIWPEAVTKFDENVSKLMPQKVVIVFFRQENTKFTLLQ